MVTIRDDSGGTDDRRQASKTVDYPAPALGAVAARIARQLGAHLDCHRPSGDAFVVSIYGEWGIGKTYCLKQLQRHFAHGVGGAIDAVLNGNPATTLVVPVLFDPWRYEHEEHLVIPLLKTIEYELRGVASRIEAARPDRSRLAQTALANLKNAIAVFADVAVALACGFKFKLAPLKAVLGVEIEFAGKDAYEVAEKRDAKRQAAPPAPSPSATDPLDARLAALASSAQRESLYFESTAALQALTSGTATPLRLVVLIDDLDRCLPEKAVQVLESVKLFLNVPGFSFVLAVDDEVVERGIAYRYRDYRPLGDAARAGAAPISGAEYLEKIVHLPVHLPRWTRQEAEDFLLANYASLFAPPKPQTETAPGLDRKTEPDRAAASPKPDVALLLRLVAGEAVPLVPRKLIRLAEALNFHYEHFVQLGEQQRWSPLHVARLIALQQLYPSLYRHVRTRPVRYWRLFDVKRDTFGKLTSGGQSRSELAKPSDSPQSTDYPPLTGSQSDTVRERQDLLDQVQQASQSRGAPDPVLLFAPLDGLDGDEWRTLDSIAPGYPLEAFRQLYIHGLKPPAPPAPAAEDQARPVAVIRDPDRFIDALLDPDALARKERLESSEAIGKRLPDPVFAALMRRLAEPPHQPRVGDIAWLRDVAQVTSPEQLLSLYNRHDVLGRILESARS